MSRMCVGCDTADVFLAEDSEAMAVMASLRAKVAEKSAEIDNLHQKMSTLAKEHEADVSARTINQ